MSSGLLSRIPKPAILVCFCTLALVASSSVAGGPGGALSITRDVQGEYTGEFAHAGTTVFFSSKVANPKKTELSVVVNGTSVDGVYNPKSQTLVINGFKSALFEDEKAALQQLSMTFERDLRPYDGGLPMEKHLLVSLVLMLSEAPVGFTLDSMEIQVPPDAKTGERKASGTDPEVDEKAAADGFMLKQCTNVNDDNGVTYTWCPGHWERMYHDACPLHGWGYLWEWTGCDFVTQCLARCGPGCGATGAGKYTWDCGDHDSCCRTHGGCWNPWDNYCGDEYSDAVNDYFAWSNCSGCMWYGSCAGWCGWQSPSGCWCDEYCQYYGDCCWDYDFYCGW